MAPVTRILQRRGTEIDCTPLIPAKFTIGGRWYTTDQRLRESTPPNKLTADVITSWSYTSLPSLMQSGVNDAESLERMKSMVYEQGDKKIASSVLHKAISRQHPNLQGFTFDALISERIIDNAFNKYWSKFISWSTWLGNVTSTALGINMITRMIKFAVDTLIHGRILCDIYGFGWLLLASFWDSLTNLLSHRNVMKRYQDKDDQTECITLAPQPSNKQDDHHEEEPNSESRPRAHPRPSNIVTSK